MAQKSLKVTRGQSDTDLQSDVVKLRDQLFRLRWQATAGSLENPNKIREVRRSIARHLTVLRERAAPAAGKSGDMP